MALPCLSQTTLVSGVGGQLPGCRFFLVERRDDWGSHTHVAEEGCSNGSQVIAGSLALHQN